MNTKFFLNECTTRIYNYNPERRILQATTATLKEEIRASVRSVDTKEYMHNGEKEVGVWKSKGDQNNCPE